MAKGGNKNSGRRPMSVEARRIDLDDTLYRASSNVAHRFITSRAPLEKRADKGLRAMAILHKTEVEYTGDLNLNWESVFNVPDEVRKGTEAKTAT
jgi:hypothetical protein